MKPIVKYNDKEYSYIEQGIRASVYALKHPKLGTLRVITSTVLAINDDGSFETINTIYQPVKGIIMK